MRARLQGFGAVRVAFHVYYFAIARNFVLSWVRGGI